MVFFFVVLKTILLPVEQIPIQPTNETVGYFILLDFLLTLTQGSELIHNNSPNDLLNDHLNNQQVNEIQ